MNPRGQVNPMASSRGETVCSLNFATRVRTVELGKAKAHSTVDMEEIGRLKSMVGVHTQLCEHLAACTPPDAGSQQSCMVVS
jgi:hypothetical protein